MSETRKAFLNSIQSRFPALTQEVTAPLAVEQLLSEQVIELPKDVLKQAQDFARACFSLRQNPAYKNFLAPELNSRGLQDPGNHGIAMSYDFHLNDSGKLQLIEINTNASFLALGTMMYEARKISQPVVGFQLDQLRDCLLQELSLIDEKVSAPKTLIIDDQPEQQRLYLEFLVYRELFKSWGWEASIADSREAFGKKADLIYNRDTDFFLERPEIQTLRKAWAAKEICLSPQPVEYLALADKQRQIDWLQPGFFKDLGFDDQMAATIHAHLPKAEDLTSANAEDVWARRKQLFFKPKRSFGAKQSYRGASISNKAFLDLVDKDILAQEFVAAPEIEITTPDGPQKMKYDLRFYAYQDRVQSVVARLYQGQVTNLRTPHGGFTPVRFV